MLGFKIIVIFHLNFTHRSFYERPLLRKPSYYEFLGYRYLRRAIHTEKRWICSVMRSIWIASLNDRLLRSIFYRHRSKQFLFFLIHPEIFHLRMFSSLSAIYPWVSAAIKQGTILPTSTTSIRTTLISQNKRIQKKMNPFHYISKR